MPEKASNTKPLRRDAFFKHSLLMSGFGNAFFYTIFGTIINLAMTIAACTACCIP